MAEQHFNLVTDPWIKVIDQNNLEKKISLDELFQNTKRYRQLAGEMRSQDLAILRFLLAILTTVYSRFDSHDHPYSWLTLDKESMRPVAFDSSAFEFDPDQVQDDLYKTWHDLYQSKTFTKAVHDYLHHNLTSFDLFDDEKPFYQVTQAQYDAAVPANKSVAKGKGTVAIKQINRTISESNNKPDVFSPKDPRHKDAMSIDELVRWLITYQNFTAVTDKTKINSDAKFSVSRGWLYGLNPVLVAGHDLFDILILNLVLIPQGEQVDENLVNQQPVWERTVTDYIEIRRDDLFPSNLAELYTTWSRIIHIEWDEQEEPLIFSAGLPKLNNEDAFLEPMTTWKNGKKAEGAKPNLRWLNSLGKAMWRNFGQYVSLIEAKNPVPEPGIVSWVKSLKQRHLIDRNTMLHLMTVGLINDGNATSQSPAAEFVDEMSIKAEVLFDDNPVKQRYWPGRINDTVELTNKVGDYVWRFANNIGKLRGVSDPGAFANRVSASFYERLNQPFNEWLAHLTNEDERDVKVGLWEKQLQQIAFLTANELLNKATPQEIRGKDDDKDKMENVFIYYRIFRGSVMKITGGKKNESSN